MTGCCNTYNIDTLVVLQESYFSASDGTTPVDPTSVNLFIEAPDGTQSEVTPSRISTGVYQYELLANHSGIWTYQFQGTGTVQVTSPVSTFSVNTSPFLPA